MAEAGSMKVRDALRAAQLYYLQDLTMEAIAREMHTSRSSVSRLISHARDTGLVSISVHSPLAARSQIEERLAERFGITVHIVPTTSHIGEAERLDRTALSAARILSEHVDSSMTVGIAWGSTLSAIARHLPTKRTHDTHVVQMNGAANGHTFGVPYAGEILSRFGAAWSASVHHFPVPALFDEAATKEAMWRERSVRAVLQMQRRVGLFVFGLGSPRAAVPSHVYSGDYFDQRDLALIEQEGVVGDCATMFYRIDGSSDIPSLNLRSSGPDLDDVRRIPRRFCVMSGLSKIDALQGALAAGLITDLVLEETVARRLMSLSRTSTRSAQTSPKPSSTRARSASIAG
ncbi:deoxyribonucleoside regulator [Microbacterium sp. SORGH_AS428]|uniref:sugar-binding transcriptional regulator n=1 Tax=Microbacterium sp. SORGH_AS_0428 TaxID=3041788 RepID=UPI002863E308|nr:sugar-binding domain-containing protein [Microbacterium sp. SORGH_AS_0428]MDR6198951.1 deoxyribonucleoside regulator [Microbacterium sp. SORGH_AS_0428]